MAFQTDDSAMIPDLDLSFDSDPETAAFHSIASNMNALSTNEADGPTSNSTASSSKTTGNAQFQSASSSKNSGNSSDSSATSPPSTGQASDSDPAAVPASGTTKKRPSTDAAADPNAPPSKAMKRRAARACASCRARKVRCDVVEGAPCGNCRWDNIECIVQESRRRKKPPVTANAGVTGAEAQLRAKGNGTNIPISIQSGPGPVPVAPLSDLLRADSSGAVNGMTSADKPSEGHVPHMLYQRTALNQDAALLSKLQAAASADSNARRLLANLVAQAQAASNKTAPAAQTTSSSGMGDSRTSQFLASLEDPDLHAQLPPFVKPLPSRIASEDVKFLHAKGALTLPQPPLQNALLQAYIEYVHPYMPLMDLHEFLGAVNAREGQCGQVSLFLYQATMFAATAFVDMKSLRDAGYATRKAARRAFFQKTRLLYDFDYEADRLVLVQALLLMTYWYETPDDQKDTWHWMGVAISLAHTIGLHRNPAATAMPMRKQKLWKRIWWSCFMRDRLVALGMRRPTRIKDEDYDVPMLTEADFEIEVLPEDNTVVPASCTLVRDKAMQQELASMCVAKAQLCICISSMLKAQYSVLIRDNVRPDNTVNSTMMLFPNKKLDNFENVTSVDMELIAWSEALPSSCQYRPLTPLDVKNGRSTLAVQRTLLHMVYYTTISALHRPQFLPSSPSRAPAASRQVQEMSRLRVRDAAMHITRMASELHQLRLERYLPTTGVTVILPAMIIHLLEMKNPMPQARDRATRGFRQCMRVMEKLREIYAAADYATGFLDAALSKAAIDINAGTGAPTSMAAVTQQNLRLSDPAMTAQTPPPENAPYMTSSEALFAAKPDPMAHSGAAHGNGSMANGNKNQFPQTINAAVLDLSTAGTNGRAAEASPPQTERDLDSAMGGLTPSASGGSEALEPLDLDFLQGQTDIDWNAVAGTDFDMDQWLQFPPEGVNNSDENLMANVFSEEGMQDAMNWAAGGVEQEMKNGAGTELAVPS